MRESSRSASPGPPGSRALNARHRQLYLEWLQSRRTGLLVGEPASRFLVPIEFLRRRSRTFRKILKLEEEGDLVLSETSVPTFEEFVVWTHTPRPGIDTGASFDEVVQLGIFAWKYQIPSLSNQITDVIRARVASREWPLQASILDNIYDAVPSGSPLREVVRAALGQLPRPNAEGEVLREEWKATFLKHAELGWDYIQAGANDWKAGDYLSGVCAFHDHEGVSHHGTTAYCDGCPFSHEDCYPDEIKDDKPVTGFPNGDVTTDEVADRNERKDGASPTADAPSVDQDLGSAITDTSLNAKANVSHKDEIETHLKHDTPTPSLQAVDGFANEVPELEGFEEVQDEDSGVKETDSVAEVDGTTVTSDGPADELNSAKENESVIEEVDDQLEESKPTETEVTVGKTAPEVKSKNKKKSNKRRNTNRP